MGTVALIIGSSAASTYVAGWALNTFLVNTAIGLALYALSPKPSLNTSQRSNRGYNVTQNGSALDRQIVYGRARVGGVRVFDGVTGTNNKQLHRVVAFTDHEIDSFDEIYINDELVTLDTDGSVLTPTRFNGYVRIKEHLGTSTQVADADLVSEVTDWTASHRLRGISYLYIRFTYDADVFPNGVPEVSATIKGKKVYDPRQTAHDPADSSTWAWSDNPALCIRDYICSDYGLNESYLRIDETLLESAADLCDETSTLGGDTRYTCNGSFTTNQVPIDILQLLTMSMAGVVWYSQGKWGMRGGEYVAPTLTLDEDDLRSTINVSTRHSRRDNFNTVSGTWRGPGSNWQVTDFTPVTSATYVSADNGEEISTDLNLAFTDTFTEARRLALIMLERNRQQLSIQARFGLNAFKLRIGDVVNITNSRMGWTTKPFEVATWTFGLDDDLVPFVDMTLRETASTVFDENDDGAAYEQDNTTLLDPYTVPAVGLSLANTTTVINQRILNVIEVDVTSTNTSEVDFVEVQYKKSSASTYKRLGTGELGLFQILDVEDDDYDVRARAINALGVKGDWTTETSFSVSTSTQTINDVTGFAANLNDGTITLSWDAVTDQNLSHYLLRWAREETGASWSNSSTVVDKVPRPGTSITVPTRPGTYLIRAVTKTGVQSVNNTTVVVPDNALRNWANETETTPQETTFSGTKSGTTVVSNQLVLSSYATAPTEGTYDFVSTDYIDTTSARVVRSWVDFNVLRDDGGATLFDDLVGNIDSLAGLWDDLTSFTQVSDIDVKSYISTTTDDPSGTPTWSSWQQFQAGEFYGRAFKFRVKLLSTSDNVTPAITNLSAWVLYD